MPDYNSNEIVDILLVLGERRDNYRRAAALYQRFPRRRHPVLMLKTVTFEFHNAETT